MKKVIALALALIMALSCGMMAFATDDDPEIACPYCNSKYVTSLMAEHKAACAKNPANTTTAAAAVTTYTCTACGKVFDNMSEYNDHLDTHWKNAEYHWDKYVGTDVVTLFSNLIDIFESTGIFEMLKNLVEKVWGLIEQGIDSAASAASVAGALSDLEAKVIDLGFGDNVEIKELINNIKSKIKSLYGMNEKATTVEATVAEAPADTGSATAGIAAFAALSMAAAAAYVCTKKKD